MTKPILHFAHANGVPSACYQKMLAVLAQDYQVVCIPIIGTSPKYPITNHWFNLAQQVADSIESQAQGQPALVLGHSLGAMTSYLAAHHYPHLFKALVMLDPPLLNGLPAYTFHVARYFGLDGNMTPAKRSQSRREIWTSREEAALALRPKALFKAFDADCFADYINYGFTECEEGVKLTIPVATEVAIFKTAPSNSWRYWRKLKVPAALVVGKQSHFAQTGCPERLARWQPVSLQYIEGGHMFPLENPLETAALVKQLFDGLI